MLFDDVREEIEVSLNKGYDRGNNIQNTKIIYL